MPVDLQSAVNLLFAAILGAILVLVREGVAYLVAVIKVWLEKKKHDLGVDKYNRIIDQVTLVVQAVEKMAITGAIKNEAETKLDWATEELSHWAERIGYKLEPTELRTLIEAAINEGLHKGSGETQQSE